MGQPWWEVAGGGARTMLLEGEGSQHCFGVNSEVGGDGGAACVGVGISREP